MSVGGACVTQGAVPLPVGAGTRAAMDIFTLYALMDSSSLFNTINLGGFIVYIEGSQL